ncbi:treacle protein-like isoform X1 [Heptranchias perlo]|uniref:treacle protein-like isoform X1 n=1 Tax=Heptranchias perlo TaxID=212740 RepID=UPI00355A59E7
MQLQIAISRMMASVTLAMLLPVTVLANKLENQGLACCPGYVGKDVKPGYFNQFEKSYQMIGVCGTHNMAVVFKHRKIGTLCVDPKKDWAKLLMKRINKAKTSQRDAAQNNKPEKHAGARNTTPGIGKTTRSTSTSAAPTSTPVTTTHKEKTCNPEDSTQAQGSSKSPGNPQQGEGAGNSEEQTRTDPSTPEGDTTTMSSSAAPEPPPSTPSTVAHGETTRSPTAQQGSSKNPGNPQQGEGAGNSEEQTRTDPSTPEGDTTTMSSSAAPEPPPSTPSTVAHGETTRSPTAQQGCEGSETRPPSNRASPTALGKAQTIGHPPPSRELQLSPAHETPTPSGQRDSGRKKKGLTTSETAVLILVPTTLVLLSVIATMYFKKKARAGTRYKMAPSEIAEGVYDSL